MNDDSILGGALGQLGKTVKQAAKQVVKMPEEMVKDVGGQVGGKPASFDESKQGQKQGWQSDEERIKFLKDLYGKSDMPQKESLKADKNPNSSADKKPSEFQEQIADKSPEEQKQLTELRSQLHKEVYYDPIFNPVKKQEERPAEKVEKEKKQEMMELQEKEEKKPTNWAVKREQNKAEMFRGAAG